MKMPVVGKIYNKKSINYKYRITALRYIVYGLNQEIEGRVIEFIGEEKDLKDIHGCRAYFLSNINKFWEEFEEIEDQPVVNDLKEAIDELENSKGTKVNLGILKKNYEVQKYRIEAISCGDEGHLMLLENVAGLKHYASLGFFRENYDIIKRVNPKSFDALDDSNIPEKADCGISEDTKEKIKFYTNPAHGLVDAFEEKPESIWKSVEERPQQLDNVGADIPCYILDGQGYYRFGLFSVKNFYEHTGRLIEFGKLNEPIKYCTLTDFINDHEQLKERIKKLEEK